MNVIDSLVDNVLTAAARANPSAWAIGTITNVAAGAATDGQALVTVQWGGAAVQAAYGAHYTPVVGHVVLLARVGPQLAIVMRLIGTPPTA